MVTTAHPDRVACVQPNIVRGRVALIAKSGNQETGIGRYVHMLQQGLVARHVRLSRVVPTLPTGISYIAHKLAGCGLDLAAFLATYPLTANYPPAEIYHFTSQNLATLLLFRRPPGRIVVTVHDIIPYVLRNQPQFLAYRSASERFFDRLAMVGLRRADLLIADSAYTKQCLIEQLTIAPEKIRIVHLGVDLQHFAPRMVPAIIWQQYGLDPAKRYLIYVGSEDPRKNLPTLVQALAEVRRVLPDVALLKVGQAHFATERGRLLQLAQQLDIASALHFVERVPEDHLALLYNLAKVCVMPSLYEGFGFPVLEAMACGTPVVCAESSSLPELTADAALRFTSHDAAACARLIVQVLEDQSLATTLRTAGLQRAAAFSWEATLQEVISCYQAAQP
jgi:glycosyltransferase involved in cell wall biosynthesis